MLNRIRNRYHRDGVLGVVWKLFEVSGREMVNALRNVYFRITPSGTFSFHGSQLKYFRHSYNLTYQNERTVEIPIADWFLRAQAKGARILEVGNVLGNYGFGQQRDVLDKYDSSPGLINEDVIDFVPSEKYDAIISVSTMEHVGWDESERDAGKIPEAINNLRNNCLRPGGTILVTLPLGYNAYFDEYLEGGAAVFSERYYLKRVSADNKWEQVDYSKVVSSKFGEPYINANAMFIGIVRA